MNTTPRKHVRTVAASTAVLVGSGLMAATAPAQTNRLIVGGLVAILTLGAIFAAIGIVVRQRATMDVPAEKGVSTVMLRTLGSSKPGPASAKATRSSVRKATLCGLKRCSPPP